MDAVSTLPGRLYRVAGGATSAAGVAEPGALALAPLARSGEPPASPAVWPGDASAPPAPSASWGEDQRALDALHRGLRVRRHPSLLLHWLGRWFRRPRAVVPDALGAVRQGEVAITFLGHASVLLRYRDLAVLLDPMLGNWIGGVRRAVAPPLSAAALADVELILISHRHLDHLHPATLAQLPKRATVVVPAGAAAEVSPLGFARVVELRPGADFEMRGLTVSPSPLAHGEGELASGLAYLLAGLGPSLYFCADSAYHAGFAELGRRHAPDIALLPIGGFWPRSFRRRHMSPLDALAAFRDLRARALVPIHHGAFALSYERLDEPLRILLETASARGLRDYVLAMTPGQTDAFALESPPALAAEPGGVGRASP